MAFCTRETFAKSTRKHKINMRTSRSIIANSRSFTLRIESKLGFVHKRQWSTGDSPLSFALLQIRQRCCVVSRKCRFSELPTVLQIRRFSSTCAHCDTVRVVRIVSFKISERSLSCRRQWTVLCTCDSTTESARTVIPVRSSREIRGNSSIREGSFTGERAFRENHAIHHESGKLVDASIYRQVSHGPTTGTAHAGIYMRILLRAVSRLIKGKVKAIGVETDFREKLRVRHALSSNDKPSPFPYYSLPM